MKDLFAELYLSAIGHPVETFSIGTRLTVACMQRVLLELLHQLGLARSALATVIKCSIETPIYTIHTFRHTYALVHIHTCLQTHMHAYIYILHIGLPSDIIVDWCEENISSSPSFR